MLSDDCLYNGHGIGGEDRVVAVDGMVRLPDTINPGERLSAAAAFQLAAQLCIAAMEVDR